MEEHRCGQKSDEHAESAHVRSGLSFGPSYPSQARNRALVAGRGGHQALVSGTPIALWFRIMDRKTQICTRNLLAAEAPSNVRAASCSTRQRLVQGFSRLQDIQLVRNHRQDPHFGKVLEERIIWRELLELEVQDVDELIERVSGPTGSNLRP